ncbi:hypothetical protein PYCC9005_001412 [Savitreella phatthalungensis]
MRVPPDVEPARKRHGNGLSSKLSSMKFMMASADRTALESEASRETDRMTESHWRLALSGKAERASSSSHSPVLYVNSYELLAKKGTESDVPGTKPLVKTGRRSFGLASKAAVSTTNDVASLAKMDEQDIRGSNFNTARLQPRDNGIDSVKHSTKQDRRLDKRMLGKSKAADSLSGRRARITKTKGKRA